RVPARDGGYDPVEPERDRDEREERNEHRDPVVRADVPDAGRGDEERDAADGGHDHGDDGEQAEALPDLGAGAQLGRRAGGRVVAPSAEQAAEGEHDEPDEADGPDEAELLPALRLRYRAEPVALALGLGEGVDAVVDAREQELGYPEPVHLRLGDPTRDRLVVLSVLRPIQEPRHEIEQD